MLIDTNMSNPYKKYCTDTFPPGWKRTLCLGAADVPTAFYLNDEGKRSRAAIGKTAQSITDGAAGVAMATGFGEYAPAIASAGNEFNRVISSFKKGGMVKKTGIARVHAGEMVVPKNRVKAVKKAMRSAGLKAIQ